MKLKDSFLLGVDLVELETAKSFYRAHGKHLQSVFSREEISYIRKDKNPHERLAVLLAAKESVFKALSLAWMGTSGFHDIEVFPRSNDRLAIRLRGPFRRLKRIAENLEILLLKKHRHYIVVGCRGID